MVEGYVKCVVAKQTKSNLYNIDEKGISENHNPPKVVGDKHVTPVSVTSGMSGTVTVLGSGNALSPAIPPYFVFVGKRMRSELLEGATPFAFKLSYIFWNGPKHPTSNG
jgi:hypothetical protein